MSLTVTVPVPAVTTTPPRLRRSSFSSPEKCPFYFTPSSASFSPSPSQVARNCSLFPVIRRPRLSPLPALGSDVPHPHPLHQLKNSKSFDEWDSLTAGFAGAANIPFLVLQMPQIILNARNLMASNKTALLAVPWLGMLTGLLGNLSLLSYFAKKREKEAVVVQALGVVSIYIVLSQLAMADAMPLPQFVATSVVVATGLVLNFLNYFGMLNAKIWHFWEDFITVGGVSVLPQVMWSNFVPYVPNSILPGSIAFLIAVATVIMARTGKLPKKGVKFVESVSGWTATLLFMWMPVSQMWTNLLNPDNIKGLSAFSMLLGMIGNGLMIPRALFIRDLMCYFLHELFTPGAAIAMKWAISVDIILMLSLICFDITFSPQLLSLLFWAELRTVPWFTGSTWGTLFYGYGNILCMFCFNSVSREFFVASTIGLISWIGMTLWKDTAVHGYHTPLRSLKDLAFGP